MAHLGWIFDPVRMASVGAMDGIPSGIGFHAMLFLRSLLFSLLSFLLIVGGSDSFLRSMNGASLGLFDGFALLD